jgi:hypothetical protein
MESMDTDQLIRIFEENDRESYSDEAFRIIREVLIERQVELPPQKEYKSCPNCMKNIEVNQKICNCGYNFDENNLDEMYLVKRKRIRYNRLSGVFMIVVGGIFLLAWLPDYYLHKTMPFIHGIPPIMILIGLWRLFFGASAKAPTKTMLDYILGDKNSKDEGDDMAYFFCPSCGKQLLKEMQYKKCPSCNSAL